VQNVEKETYAAQNMNAEDDKRLRVRNYSRRNVPLRFP